MFGASSPKFEAECEFKLLSQGRSTGYCMFQQLGAASRFFVSVRLLRQPSRLYASAITLVEVQMKLAGFVGPALGGLLCSVCPFLIHFEAWASHRQTQFQIYFRSVLED